MAGDGELEAGALAGQTQDHVALQTVHPEGGVVDAGLEGGDDLAVVRLKGKRAVTLIGDACRQVGMRGGGSSLCMTDSAG